MVLLLSLAYEVIYLSLYGITFIVSTYVIRENRPQGTVA
jgi:hypothetical protein